MITYRIALLESCPLSKLGYQYFCGSSAALSIALAVDAIEKYKLNLIACDFDAAIIDPVEITRGRYDEGIFDFLEYYHQHFVEKPLIIYTSDTEFMKLYPRLYEHPWVILPKTLSPTTLYDIIRNYHFNKHSRLKRKLRFTHKECCILQMMMRGSNLAEVAQISGCSVKTVSGHKINALKKFLSVNHLKAYSVHPVTMMKIPRFTYSLDDGY